MNHFILLLFAYKKVPSPMDSPRQGVLHYVFNAAITQEQQAQLRAFQLWQYKKCDNEQQKALSAPCTSHTCLERTLLRCFPCSTKTEGSPILCLHSHPSRCCSTEVCFLLCTSSQSAAPGESSQPDQGTQQGCLSHKQLKAVQLCNENLIYKSQTNSSYSPLKRGCMQLELPHTLLLLPVIGAANTAQLQAPPAHHLSSKSAGDT